jgi:hypothetical protein
MSVIDVASATPFLAEDVPRPTESPPSTQHPAADPDVGNQLCWPLLEWRGEAHSLRCRPAQSAALLALQRVPTGQPAMPASRPAARHLT